jgi:lauroyl/myristoyl acyltransferase
MIGRRLWSWKTLFYRVLVPALRRLGPSRADQVLGWLGRWFGHRLRRRALEARLMAACRALEADWRIASTATQLAASRPRLLARDLLLDGLSDEQALARFDVTGFEAVEQAIGRGQGLILLGNHFGAHLAGLHWLDRRGVPLRMLVQRPRHVSRRLSARFETDDPRFPQREFTLRRGMPPTEAARCVLLARDALRAGICVYLNGDIPCTSSNSRPGTLLGRAGRFLTVWADLAALSGAPVVPIFCSARPDGRFRLYLERPWSLAAGDQAVAVARYLAFLDDQIRADPSAAALHFSKPAVAEPPFRQVVGRPVESRHIGTKNVP